MTAQNCRSLNAIKRLLPVVLVAMPTLGAGTLAADQPALGISASKPTDGRYVPFGDRFLVSYDEIVPGTEIRFTMVPIKGGEFTMGSPADEEGRSGDEGPQRRIRLEPFWIAKCEVTWEQYQRFMAHYDIFKERSVTVTEENQVDAVTCPTPLYDPSFTYALGEEAQQPAVTMSQYAAKQYTKWLSKSTGRIYRLPAESEWEYACRAGTATRYSWGDDTDDLDAHAWYYDNSDDMYQEVGQKAANPWGLHDMHGNVAEYVLDGLAPYRAISDPESPLSLIESIHWPEEIFGRVVRGGSWQSDPEDLRSAARSADDDWRVEDPNLPKSPWWFTDEQALCVGFRVMRQVENPDAAQAKRFWDADVEEIVEDIEFRVSEGRGVFGVPTTEAGRDDQR